MEARRPSGRDDAERVTTCTAGPWPGDRLVDSHAVRVSGPGAGGTTGSSVVRDVEDRVAVAGPLEGIRVLDLSRVLAGPLCTMWLADLGADVVKVEAPSGDDTRSWGPPWAGDHATYFLAVNRGKRSVVLDLRDAEHLAVARSLAADADVVVQNFRRGGLERFGLDVDAVRAANPDVVYVSVSGFGRDSDRPGYDLLAQAEGGLMGITGDAGPTKVGVAISDVLTGLHATVGVLAALRVRDGTGEGQHVEVDLLRSTVASLVNQASGWLDAGVVPTPMGNRHPSIVPYEVLPTASAPLALAVGNDGQFATLVDLLDDDGLRDPRFATNDGRVAHRDELVPLLVTHLVRRPAEEWVHVLDSAGVPAGRVNDMAEVFTTADRLGLDLTTALTMSDGTRTRQVRSPVVVDGATATAQRPPPLLDEHGDEIRTAGGW